MQRCILQI